MKKYIVAISIVAISGIIIAQQADSWSSYFTETGKRAYDYMYPQKKKTYGEVVGAFFTNPTTKEYAQVSDLSQDGSTIAYNLVYVTNGRLDFTQMGPTEVVDYDAFFQKFPQQWSPFKK